MRVAPALAASVLVHGAVLVGLRGAHSRTSSSVSSLSPSPSIELLSASSLPPASDPVEVEIIQLPEPVPAAAQPALPSTAAGAGSRIEASRSRSRSETARDPATDGSTPGSDAAGGDGRDGDAGDQRMLRMRRPEKRELELPAGALAIALEPGTPYVPPPPSGHLNPAGGGESVARSGPVKMHVDRDGRASFDDEGDGEFHIGLPIPTSRKALGQMLEGWAKDPYAQTEAPPIQDLPQHEQAVPGGWDSGSRAAGGGGGGGGVGGGFDITAWAMKKAGMDPYQARKQKLLEETYDERAEQRAVHTADQLDHADQLVRKNLARLWTATTDAAERRLALFEMWDECEEGEGRRAEAGHAARKQIDGWIRAKLPATGADAYTVDELAELNAKRRSTQRFDPYRGLPSEHPK
jgi:hypothetical protein